MNSFTESQNSKQMLSKFTWNNGTRLNYSTKGSYLSIAIALVKNTFRDVIIDTQKHDPSNDLLGWSESGIGILKKFRDPLFGLALSDSDTK